MWKSGGTIKKEQWFLLLLAGAVLMILGTPAKKKYESGSLYEGGKNDNAGIETESGTETAETAGGRAVQASSDSNGFYETQMEERIRSILEHVDGVGQVDVMVVLKSSEEKVLRIDKNQSSSVTKEQDTNGGTREISQSDSEETTVLAGSGGASQNQPIVEKEICPEISGIIVSAAGGGSPRVKTEISEAMEALFGLPPHKIKVLKRVE